VVNKLPLVVFSVGIFISILPIAFIPRDVFFSGDGGVKWLLVDQFARGHVTPVLNLTVPASIDDAWRFGLFPLQPPFVYSIARGHIVSFPLLFEVLTTPFYLLFGYRGLYVLPVVGVWGTWLVVWRTLRQLDLDARQTALHLFLLVFCTNLTLFAAAFWEHSLAVFAACPALAYLVVGRMRPQSAHAAGWTGFLLGLSFMLRSELLLFAVMASLYVLVHSSAYSHSRWFILATVSTLAAALLSNLAIYGHALGLHSEQVLSETTGSRFNNCLHNAVDLWSRFLGFVPCAVPVIAVIVVAFLVNRRESRGSTSAWASRGLATVCFWFLLLLPAIVPNSGGKQLGPRYLLVLTPAAILMAGDLWAHHVPRGGSALRWARVLWVAAGVAGFALDSVYEGHRLIADYRSRVSPALEYVRTQPERVLCITNSVVAQELAALFPTKLFLLTESLDGFARGARAAQSLGQTSAVVISAWEQPARWLPKDWKVQSEGSLGMMSFYRTSLAGLVLPTP
jgi:hypothetical protein